MKSMFLSVVFWISLFPSCLVFAAESLSVAPRDGHSIFYDSIDKAKQSIDMVMFRLTDTTASSKILAAQKRGVHVRVILDAKATLSPSATTIQQQLQAAGVEVRLSSPSFSITHGKAAVFDGQWALITSMNLTRTATFSRDFGIRTDDASVVAEFEKVFAADWDNSQNQTGLTPTLSVDSLLWSPVNSKNKILDYIASTQKTLLMEVENLGDQSVLLALKTAAARGVQVTLLVPACVAGSGSRNLPYMKDLAKAGVDARLSMPPYTASNPYIHAKSFVKDGTSYYVGSENLSYNSLTAAREVGLIKEDASLSAQISEIIAADVALAKAAQEVPDNLSCN